MSDILVAGVGNIFQGDDAFGVEVAQRLIRRKLPPGVTVVDFGIRGIDLTYALLDGHRAAVLVDTVRRGDEAGTLYVIEPDQPSAGELVAGDLALSPHDLDPAKVLRLVAALGGSCRRIVLVGCEPLTFGEDGGAMGLSAPVAAAVERAVTMIEELIETLLEPAETREE